MKTGTTPGPDKILADLLRAGGFPISLLSVLYKLFRKIILTRISQTLGEAHPVEQAGFRIEFSCLDHIQALAMVIKVCQEIRMPLVLTFVDYEKLLTPSIRMPSCQHWSIKEWTLPTLADRSSRCSATVKLSQRPLLIPIEKA
ncbi:hypothetical protein V3C99_018170 [Haemonchus contortus]